MKIKIIVAAVVIVVFILFGAVSFMDSNVEYTDFSKAEKTNKKVQVKGAWVKEKETQFDAKAGQFTFYMKDDADREVKVVLDGAKPNNFELATSIVAKGRYKDGCFYANELLTKCPSKYEGDESAMKKTL
ncbi:MAG TPA: cytochrome c maturation protein CcmE [Candidatus Hodarchaeales archaeon]|nr:cytochrome c maturation protein CcmE [Candidatus Hodarchaeales archaeon]